MQVRDRWAAQGIQLLLRRHPALRVAYLDAAGMGQPSYSVLLSGASPSGEPRCTSLAWSRQSL
jgi:hypothetical protein